MPPLPPIPETFKSSITPRLVGRFFEHVKADGDKASSTTNSTIAKKSDSSSLLKLSRGKRKASLKAQISNPQLNPQGSLPLAAEFGNKGEEPKRSSDEDSVRSPVAIDWAFQYPSQAPCSSKHEFRVAQPRLSPMEYARMYLVNKAQSEKENRPAELPAPEKKWLWTPRWEKFLIIPRIPSAIRRTGPTEIETDVKENEASHSTSDMSTKVCPRLSLNLGGLNNFMPSTMNLGSLAAVGNRNSVLLHGEHASQSNPELRRYSYNSGEMRSSPILHPDVRPLELLTGKAEQMTNRSSNTSSAPDADTPVDGRRVRKQQSFPILLPRTYEKPIREFQDKAITRCQSPDKPRPGSSGPRKTFASSGNLLPMSRILSIRRHQPLEQDGLTPGRIQSMAASIIGEATPRSSSLEPLSGSSPGILFTIQQSPPTLIERVPRTSSLNHRQASSPRRHSFSPVTPVSPRPQTLESDVSMPYTMGSITSPTLDMQRLENDPFTDTPLNSATLSRGERTSQLPIPDSPTLGRRHEEQYGLFAESRDQVDAEESFQLLKSYMRSRKSTFANQWDNGNSPGQSSDRQGQQQTTKDSKSGNHGGDWYNSSFALNKARSHEAFTLLPRVSPTSIQKNSTSPPPGVEVPHLNRSPQNVRKTRAMSDTSTALALQNFDTASRLASAVAQHDSIAAETASIIQSQDPLKRSIHRTNKPSKLGSLLSRHMRRRSSGGSTAAMGIKAPDSKTLKKYDSRDRVFSKPGVFRNHVDSQEQASAGSVAILGTQLQRQQQQQRADRAVSGSSYSGSSFAGLRDKLKFKMAPS